MSQRAERRQLLVALITDNGGADADLHKLAQIAIATGLYSPTTNLCDIRMFLERAWFFRHRAVRP